MHRPRLRIAAGGALLAGLLLLAGPGCSSGPTLAEVEGTVTLGGTPLPGVQVLFSPDVGKDDDGRLSSAVTDDKGHFVLTFADAKQPRPGALVGKHKVMLIDHAWENARGDPKRGPRRIPDPYNTAGTTPLTATVTPGKNTIPLTVKP